TDQRLRCPGRARTGQGAAMIQAGSASLQITPADALIDMPRRIVASGLPAGTAHVTATLQHPDGSRWRSTADFEVGADGVLDLDARAPLRGDWDVADAMAVVWAMRRDAATTAAELSEETAVRQMAVEVVAGPHRVEASCVQRDDSAGVARCELPAEVSGTLFTPATPGP